jgi:nucleoid-associated protein YgaU
MGGVLMAELEKAYLKVEGGTQIPCLFNPETLSLGASNNWSAEAAPGKGVQKLAYKGANSGTMSLELMFDTTASGAPVTNHTSKLMKLMEIDTSLPGTDETTNNARPPTVSFHWGNLHSFQAIVSNLQLTFTYFSSSGVPLRAKASISLTQYMAGNSYGPQNPTSGTPRPSRVHRVQPGETLDRISARYYGDSTRWRVLASANGLEDPLAIRAGALLDIPRMEG